MLAGPPSLVDFINPVRKESLLRFSHVRRCSDNGVVVEGEADDLQHLIFAGHVRILKVVRDHKKLIAREIDRLPAVRDVRELRVAVEPTFHFSF